MTAIPNSCYWKIEADKFQEGGKVAWDKSYRLRHYLTGRYLKLIVKEKGVSHAILTSSAGSDTLFRFCPIENAEMKQGKFLWKDSFFYFMHMETSKYLGITDEDEIEDPPELVAA
jgi:inositol 1,4,5-triphosphate receptor type 3